MASMIQYQVEPEEDDPTSSSENESLSGSDSDSNNDNDDDRHSTSTVSQARAPSIGRHSHSSIVRDNGVVVDGLARKIVKARDANLRAWRCASLITAGQVVERDPPWEGLLRAVNEWWKLSRDPKVIQCEPIGRSTGKSVVSPLILLAGLT